MDAVKYLETRTRMTAMDKNGMCQIDCYDCPLGAKNNGANISCLAFEAAHPEKAVEIVEKWAAEHPKRTRQTEFLKMFPKAKLESDTIIICPKHIEGEDNHHCTVSYGVPSCTQCRKEYWNQEVDDE